ncbi:nicotinamide riboside kinase 1 [Alphaentomopoxvirus acuprea]|uniref:Nicotinamide riboside kinase 1 n=1 Tax=Alphaentomopoxvirus acuprea TaxID=62099 RepID=W6JIL4_9POXV|nr:nicotinamide riboside kinase 1 [Anomala cuprea entomopoxvirus]BAO49413.1 nicotinamide riboside kinase 1 [Anomala cuprea entomopoxvirus]
MNTKYFLEGVACTCKTISLNVLRNYGLDTSIGDYFDHCNMHNEFMNKNNDLLTSLIYNFWNTMRTNNIKYGDRTPLSNILYPLIYDIVNRENITINNNDKIYLNFLIKIYNELDLDWNILIILVSTDDKTITKIVDNMKIRNNKIDILSKEYVIVQNNIFKYLSKKIKCKIYEVDLNKNDIYTIIKEICINFTDMINNNDIKKKIINCNNFNNIIDKIK